MSLIKKYFVFIALACSVLSLGVLSDVNAQLGAVECREFFDTRFTSDQDGDDINDWYDCTRSDNDPSAVNDRGRPIAARANGKQSVCIIGAEWLSMARFDKARLVLVWPDLLSDGDIAGGVAGSAIGANTDFGNPVYSIDNSYCAGQTATDGGDPPPPPPTISCSPDELIVPPTGSFTVSYDNAPSGASIRYGGRTQNVPGSSGQITATYTSTSNRQTIQFSLHNSANVQVATATCAIDNAPSGPGTPTGSGSGGVTCVNPALGQYRFTGNASSGWFFDVDGSNMQAGNSGSVSFEFSARTGASWRFYSLTSGVYSQGTLSAGCMETPPPQDTCPSELWPDMQTASESCVALECVPTANGTFELRLSFSNIPTHFFAVYSDTTSGNKNGRQTRGWVYDRDGDWRSPPRTRGYTIDQQTWAFTAAQVRQSNATLPASSQRTEAELAEYMRAGGGWQQNGFSNSLFYAELRQVNPDPRTRRSLWWPHQTNPEGWSASRYDTQHSSGRGSGQFIRRPGYHKWYSYIPESSQGAANAEDFRRYVQSPSLSSPEHKGVRIFYQNQDDASDRGAFDYSIPTTLSFGQTNDIYTSNATQLESSGSIFWTGQEGPSIAGFPPSPYRVIEHTFRPEGLTPGANYDYRIQVMGSSNSVFDVQGGVNNPDLGEGSLVRLATLRNATETNLNTAENCTFTVPREGDIQCTTQGTDRIRIRARWGGTDSGVVVQYRVRGSGDPFQPHMTLTTPASPDFPDFTSYSNRIRDLESNTQYEIQLYDTQRGDVIDSVNCTTDPNPFTLQVSVVRPLEVAPGLSVRASHTVSNFSDGDAPDIDVNTWAYLDSSPGSRINNRSQNDRDIASGDTYSRDNLRYDIPSSAQLGDEVCFVTEADPGSGFEDGSNPGPAISTEQCVQIQVRPYVSFQGGDVWAGTELTQTGSCSGTYKDAFIRTASNSNAFQNTNISGFGELAVTALGDVTGFGSAAAASPEASLTFANRPANNFGNFTQTPKCVRDYYHALSTYEDNNVSNTQNVSDINVNQHLLDDTQHFKQGDVRVKKNNGASFNNGLYEGNSTLVVDGDVTITRDLLMDTDGIGSGFDVDVPSRIIVASGNINISRTVEQVDAILIAAGDINTCTNGDGVSPVQFSDDNTDININCSRQLTINGQVMANRINFQRTRSSTTDPNPEPAEIIKYGPETLLADHVLRSDEFVPAILKTDSTKDLPPVF